MRCSRLLQHALVHLGQVVYIQAFPTGHSKLIFPRSWKLHKNRKKVKAASRSLDIQAWVLSKQKSTSMNPSGVTQGLFDGP